MSKQLAINGGEKIRTKPFQSWPIFDESDEKAVLRALRSGKWGKLAGPEVATFEKRFAEFHGCRHGIGVVNGTVSLRIALMAAGVQMGDEVIVPPYTFLATATAVVEANATPVFVDIDLDTYNMCPKAVEAAITPRTRAIMPVHFAGLPCDMDAIMAIAKKHNLCVIEDAAHAHGASYKGRRAGSIGHFGSFSFQSSKNLNSGEGGIVITNDDSLARRCWSIHNCGRTPGGLWYEHHVMSANYRLGEIQGALLNSQMDRLEAQCETRERNGKYLAAKLAKIPGIFPQKRDADITRHAYHLFMCRIDGEKFGAPRELVIKALQAEGIPAVGGYAWPLYKQPLFLNRAFGPYHVRPEMDYHRVSCPNCETICYSQACWLEQFILLGTQQDMDDIAAAFAKVYENRAELKG